MTVAGTPYARSVFVTGGPPEGPCAGKARTALFWGMIVFGILGSGPINFIEAFKPL